jgi:hypothetical protein
MADVPIVREVGVLTQAERPTSPAQQAVIDSLVNHGGEEDGRAAPLEPFFNSSATVWQAAGKVALCKLSHRDCHAPRDRLCAPG